MIGVPKHLNTRADYAFVRANFPASVWKAKYQELLDGRYIPSATDGETGEVREQTEDPNAKIFRLGFTVPEVESIISE